MKNMVDVLQAESFSFLVPIYLYPQQGRVLILLEYKELISSPDPTPLVLPEI
jgi:hypothetical protein